MANKKIIIPIIITDDNYTITDCQDGSTRLVDGPNPSEGRVEVCYNQVWGTVCNSNLNSNLHQSYGNLVCEQLGYQLTG